MAKQPEKTQDKIDVLYQWLSYELQQARDTLLTELKMTSAQIGSLYGEMKSENEQTSKAVSQEIRYSYKQNQTIYDGLSSMLTQEVGERLNAMDEKLVAMEDIQKILDELDEIKQSYMQIQGDVRALSDSVVNDVNPKLDELLQKQAVLEQLEEAINALNAKLEDLRLSEEDFQKLAETISEKTEASVAAHSEEIIEAVRAVENVDYNRIAEDVGDKVLEIMNQLKSEEIVPVADIVEEEKIDYDRIIYGAAEKVVESLPAPEKVDYSRIEDAIAALNMDALSDAVASKIVVPAAPEKVDYSRIEDAIAALNMDALSDAVASKIVVPAAPEIDYERLADLVAARIAVPAVPEVDYDRLADLVMEKMAAGTEQTCEVMLDDAGIEEIAAKVADKIPAPETIDYDKVCQAAQAAQILPDPVDYDRIAEIVEDKIANEDSTYDLVIDEEGLSAIARGVSEELCQMCANCEDEVEVEVIEAVEEAPVVEEVAEVEEVVEEASVEAAEEPVEETVEDAPVEEAVEEAPAEVVEEPVEETVEEAPVEVIEEPVEEAVEEAPVVEEVAEEPVEEAPVEEVESAADAPVEEELATTAVGPTYAEVDNELVDAETGLVIRLKRSFTAKMRQSDEKVKGYYSDIKNELTSYKKINSNVSWHGDRFNYGRDTVAKININGKTLCFYVALDPNDPEYKTTVYHQKDVSSQKAYENTPFLVKVKSDVAVKKALRLVGFLAEKLGTEKEEGFEAVNYAEEFTYQSTKQLFDEGFIKATKEKKVDFDF